MLNPPAAATVAVVDAPPGAKQAAAAILPTAACKYVWLSVLAFMTDLQE